MEPVTGNQYSSDWVEIGGFNEGTLVEAGIEADNLNGTPLYRAWTEILPAPEVPLTLTIHPGDTIKATVRETATNTWAMTVRDLTLGTKAGRKVTYHSSGASVEAIHERPSEGVSLATLAKTTNAVFNAAKLTTSAPGSSAVYTPLLTPLAGQTLYDIDMESTKVIATPSNADSDRDGFAVADGKIAPRPPTS